MDTLSLAGLAQDLRLSVRTLAKNPGFAVLTILTLTLGIGANTTIFSVVHAVLLKRLPFADPDRLVLLWEDASRIGFPRGTPAPANYSDWKAQNRIFEQIEAIAGRTMNHTGVGEPERLNVDAITAGLLPMLGVKPLSGRLFLPEDDTPAALKVALVSHALWKRQFGGDPHLVGESIRLNENKYGSISLRCCERLLGGLRSQPAWYLGCQMCGGHSAVLQAVSETFYCRS